jgi:cytochrome P450
VQRIALALGNSLITSNGESWAKHRRMIQPAFTKSVIGRMTAMTAGVNAELLQQWRAAAERRETVNVTRDVTTQLHHTSNSLPRRRRATSRLPKAWRR